MNWKLKLLRIALVIAIVQSQLLPITKENPHYLEEEPIHKGYPRSAICPHTILLSFGRSATSTVTNSLNFATPLEYCHNLKEFFAHHGPNYQEVTLTLTLTLTLAHTLTQTLTLTLTLTRSW